MKIRMLTFHTPENYGAVLQAYALQQTLKKRADDVKIVDYNTQKKKDSYDVLRKPRNIKELLVFPFAILRVPSKKRRKKKYEAFRHEFFDLTQRYESAQELYNNPPEGDLFITGSDQVFNPRMSKEDKSVYYLDFVKTRRTSYAASFGKTDAIQACKEEITSYLSKFERIAVREEYACDIVKNLVPQIPVEHTFDPVFLLTKEEWRHIAQTYPNLPEKYILFYNLRRNQIDFSFVKKKSKELGLPVVYVTGLDINMVNGIALRDVGPLEFLGLFDNASYIITDSFHGTAFSIIFQKEFMVVDCSDFRQRASALLKVLGLEKQCLVDGEEVGKAINWKKVGEQVDKHVLYAYEYIESLVSKKNGY